MWVVSNYDGAPLHMIKIYVPPDSTTKATYFARLIRWLVAQCILARNPSAKIIIAGDFNEVAIGKIGFL